ncbi:MAG: hypothetical protein CVU88_01490 [Firmicutes bacterium HGW-Firmicutes-13]|nr:MAG: hypothetical protein CVU88_01490 [Firmicutes bacterium HGW-Firmicutes-13]
MKKIILAGIILLLVLCVLIFTGKITHLTLGGYFPGTKPVEIWERDISGRLVVAEEDGNIILVEEENQKVNIQGLDFYGKSIWEEEGEDQVNFFFGESYWSVVQLPQGTIKIYDYKRKQAGIFRLKTGFNKIWLGPEGQALCIGILSVDKNTLEGLYGEMLEVYNAKGELMLTESFTGKAVLDLALVPGEDILLINLVEVFPQVSSKGIILNLEGKKLSEVSSTELFLTPLILKEGGLAAFASGQELYIYTIEENAVFKNSFDFTIQDYLLTSEDYIVLVSTDGAVGKGKTSLVCVNEEGSVLWDKDLPGTYIKGKSRSDGGIVVETDAFLYLLSPNGTSQAYFLPDEDTEIYLLSTDTFLIFNGTKLKAYCWPLK